MPVGSCSFHDLQAFKKDLCTAGAQQGIVVCTGEEEKERLQIPDHVKDQVLEGKAEGCVLCL